MGERERKLHLVHIEEKERDRCLMGKEWKKKKEKATGEGVK